MKGTIRSAILPVVRILPVPEERNREAHNPGNETLC
jgi:hypothetical protein